MLFPQTVEYALRAVSSLVILQKDNLMVSSLNLSKHSNVPSFYLSKILRKLVKAKLLIAQKGKSGGFKFAKPLKRIKIIDILDAIDYSLDKNHCAFGWKVCSQKSPCPLHFLFKDIKDKYFVWANSTTIYDINKSNLIK